MKKIYPLFFAISCIFMVMACNNSADKKGSIGDTVISEMKSVDSIAVTYVGIYSGFIPCADCAGIMTYLQLNEDMSYRLEETYQGKNDTAFRHQGTWKRNGDKIILYDNETERVSYLKEGDRLLQLDVQGNRIAGNLGDRYVLVKQALANNPAWKEKSAAGIDFIGLGNEPFWSLEIDKGFKIAFNTPDMKSPATTTYTEPVVTNGILEYHIQTESVKLDITIFPQYCSDGMSDFLYEYKVALTYNGKKYNGCGAMTGKL